jgi:hypothetical protein
MMKVAETDEAAAAKMWAALRGISLDMGGVLMKRMSALDLVEQRITITEIKGLKSAWGKAPRKGVVNTLSSLQKGDRKLEAKLLSGVQGISLKIGTGLIASAGSLSALCSRSAETMAIIAIQTTAGAKKLGMARAKRILHMCNYKQLLSEEKTAPPPATKPSVVKPVATKPVATKAAVSKPPTVKSAPAKPIADKKIATNTPTVKDACVDDYIDALLNELA